MTNNMVFEKYNNTTHLIGRAFASLIAVLILAVPFIMGSYLNAMPDIKAYLAGLAQILIVWSPSGVVEFLVYTPMLGAGGSYLAFITGNLINLKIPCVANSREISNTKVGTPENEIVSTLSIASSALVTTLVLAVGVIALMPLRPLLSSDLLKPAFDNVVPALFGALAYRYFRKNMNIVAIPLALMCLVFVLMPKLISSVGFLIIPSGALAIGIAWFFHKKQNAKRSA